jgi:hypothetical protein
MFPRTRWYKIFVIFILVHMCCFSIVLWQIIIKKYTYRKNKSITPQRFLLLLVYRDYCNMLWSNRTIFRWYICPELLTIQIQCHNHLNCYCLTWFCCRINLSCTVMYLHVCVCTHIFCLLVKYLICIMDFCSLRLMPISSTASSLS